MKRTIFSLALLIGSLLAGIFLSGVVSAMTSPASLAQQETPYAPPGDYTPFDPYSGPQETLPPAQTQPPNQPTVTAGGLTLTPVITGSLQATSLTSRTPSATPDPRTPSSTPGRNIFLTENAEMGQARVTPPNTATATSAPSQTATALPSPTPGVLQSFQFDRRLFGLGLVLPVAVIFFAWLGLRIRRSGEFSGK